MKALYETLSSSLVDDSKANIFVIVKPGFLKFTQYVINTFEEKGWNVNRIKTKQLLPIECKKLYEVHKKKDFFEDLCNYMSSDLTTAILFTKEAPMSPKVFEETGKIKDNIRKEIGESEMRNGIHSSDSLERLQIERGIYF
jgi:nucleoside-diphosphate kinase